jgi:hypothetical protein
MNRAESKLDDIAYYVELKAKRMCCCGSNLVDAE